MSLSPLLSLLFSISLSPLLSSLSSAVLECSKHLKAKGDTLSEINFYDEISSSPSGGTIATIFHALNKR